MKIPGDIDDNYVIIIKNRRILFITKSSPGLSLAIVFGVAMVTVVYVATIMVCIVQVKRSSML